MELDAAGRPIYRATRPESIPAFLDGLGKRVFLKAEILQLIEAQRDAWEIVRGVPAHEVIRDLTESLPLCTFTLRSNTYSNEFQRFSWRVPDPLEVAASIRAPKSFLIDITVRPGYAGGVHGVLNAFRKAGNAISIPSLINTLQQLNYVYPYHQALGFYLGRAGFSATQLQPLKALGLTWDFYLAHNLENPELDPIWRVYRPTGL